MTKDTDKPKRNKTPGYYQSQANYDMKRPSPVPVRFTAEELELLDQRRGEESRSGFIKRKALGLTQKKAKK